MKTKRYAIRGTKLEEGLPLPGYYFPHRTYSKTVIEPVTSLEMPESYDYVLSPEDRIKASSFMSVMATLRKIFGGV